jgi:hypothetical protein
MPRPTTRATAISTQPSTPTSTGNIESTTAITPADLENFVAENVINEDVSIDVHTSPEGAIVAHVETFTLWSDLQPSAIKVWRYSLGKFTDADPEALSKALGTVRSDWPLYTFIFAFESIGPDRAVANVYTFYNQGLSPDSRGGFAARWEFERKPDGWNVLSHIPFANWD